MIINDRIAAVMKAKALNMNTFAKETGITYITLYHTISPAGRRSDPNAATLSKIKQAFPDLDLNWLLSGEGNMFLPQSVPADELPQTVHKILEELRELKQEVKELKSSKWTTPTFLSTPSCTNSINTNP